MKCFVLYTFEAFKLIKVLKKLDLDFKMHI